MSDLPPSDENDLFGIAIVGMACRFPDARNVNEFWQNLKNGVESIRPFTEDELKASGADEKTLRDPSFVNAGTVLPDADAFDASFFGVNAREAEIMDPQHRVFLETAWEALEDAGYCPDGYQGPIGVFGGVGQNAYFQKNLMTHPDLLQMLGNHAVLLASEKEYAVTRVSFKLNLKGPSLGINTACSTSAVAIHIACQSLLSGECDMALAGGARIGVPLKAGYLYEEGGIRSPDGRCRAFDAKARGTVVGNGVGIVVLKRLSDAIRHGDCIHAVIKGSAINNDGSQKVGFTAPSIQGQAAAITEALTISGVEPNSVGYVETHGTGTLLGDPIEMAALTQAFRDSGAAGNGFCPIGSVKASIGHLDAAAGVAGVIKTALMLEHRMLLPSLNFEQPNPAIDFANSPFFVNTMLQPWKTDGLPRRAGVSSFGLGGTNAHLILEEAPASQPAGPGRSRQLLLLSARSEVALERATRNLSEHLRGNPGVDLADVAYTLQTGRRAFTHRRIVVGRNTEEIVSALEALDPQRVLTSSQEPTEREVVFLFSGQGAQYVNMGLELYQQEPVFRQAVDQCAEILKPKLSLDLRQLIYPPETAQEEAAQRLEQTAYTQLALFTIEYALATLWMDWGIKPRAMVGHSIGEYVAACLSGVFSLEDALSLVAARGRLMQEMPTGAMLAVPLSEEQLQPYLDEQVSVAVDDSPALRIVAGEKSAIDDLQKRLAAAGVEAQPLHTSHAFHSRMMEPACNPFLQRVKQVRLSAPQIPFASNVSGTWITNDEATDPNYWARQLRQPVRLRACLQEVMKLETIFLEVGPGRTLSASARRNAEKGARLLVLSSMRHPKENESDPNFLLTSLGRLWLNGVRVEWFRFHDGEKRRRVSLPTYPFERKRYWINPGKRVDTAAPAESVWADESESGLDAADSGAGSLLQADGPKSDVEKRLAVLWVGLLGVETLNVHDNFFDLGGSSLLATRLLTQISGSFGQKLPLSAIFEAPTIEKLAGLLEKQAPVRSAAKRRSSLVKIQEGESRRPPFFCVPGNLGNVFVDFEYLHRPLGSEQPFYGFQDGLGNPSDVRALAERYVEDVRRVQPEGPYFLGGICFGGPIVFEMAQQLRRQGQRVPFLALIEPATLPLPGANSYADLFDDIWKRFTRSRGGARKTVKMNLNEFITFLRLRVKLVANIWSLKQYAPQPYPDHLHVFLTKESFTKGSFLGWRDFAVGGAEIQEIPGTHRSITGDNERIEEEQMRVLGEKIKVGMDHALAEQKNASP